MQPSFFSPRDDQHQYNHHHIYDVIIVGAGWSGLSAASRLTEKGLTNIIILEGLDHIGGRSRTVYPFQQAPDLAVELGSAWTYENTEPHEMMLELNQPFGQVHYDDPSTFGLYNEQGEVIATDKEELMELWDNYCIYSHRVAKYLRSKLDDHQPHADKSYQYTMDAYLQHNNDLSPQQVEFLKSMIHAQFEIEFATSLHNISTASAGRRANQCLFCNADYFVPVEHGGFDKVLKKLAKPFKSKLQFRSKVTKVQYGTNTPDLVQVTYLDGKTNTNKTILAKTILMTVPLGVLQKGVIQFEPPLPSRKQQAIDALGMGVLNKVILYWDTPQTTWWPVGREVLTLANAHNHSNVNSANLLLDHDRSYTTFFNDHQLGNGGHFVLSAWIGGDLARAAEQEKNDNIIIAKVMNHLRTMMLSSLATSSSGQEVVVVPEPTHTIVTHWGQDEFSYGSYSYTPYRGDQNDLDWSRYARRDLAARTGSNVFWAGEAVSEKWYATTVGAYRSGRKAANDILVLLEKERQKIKVPSPELKKMKKAATSLTRRRKLSTVLS